MEKQSNAYKDISLYDLQINTENFRHNPVTDEGQAIIELLKDSEGGSKTLFDIAESINSEGYYPQQIISVYYSKQYGKYVLLDGNRRVTAIKLAKNTTLIPDTFKSIKNKFSSLKLDKLHSLTTLPCYVYNNILEAVKYLQSIHISGSGPKGWGRLQQLKFIEKYGTQNDLTYAYRICKEYLSDEEIATSKNFSTVERVLKPGLFKDIFETKEQKIYSLDEKRKILRKLISDTNKAGINSRTLNTTDDIKKYLKGELSLTLESENTSAGTGSRPIVKNPTPQEHIFTTLNYSGLSNEKPMENSLILLCAEIKELAKTSNFNKFPIAATCLIRNLLEVSLKYWLGKYQTRLYVNVSRKDGSDPTLSEMVAEINKSIVKNIDVFMNKSVNDVFAQTFRNAADDQKRWLDIIVHRPYQLSLTAKDLCINNDNGIFGIVQHILNYGAAQTKMGV